MNLQTIYTAITAEVNTITGKTYSVNYSPVRNYSEQSGYIRYVRPTRWSKTRINRGTPQTDIAVEIGVIGLKTTAADMIAIENEIDILTHALLRSSALTELGLKVLAAATNSANEGLFSAVGLEAETEVLHAAVTLTVQSNYLPGGNE